MIDDPLVPPTSPQYIHWHEEYAEPTFPEGTWSNKTAQVEAVLEEGYKYQVKFEGSYWTAVPVQGSPALQPGDHLLVLGREGNELVVQKLERPEPDLTAPIGVPEE